MAPGALEELLSHLRPAGRKDPAVLVGMNALDDAGVYRLRDDLAIVQSVDFFTPIVDDPRDYGAIAAANALSDLYAMGAEPFAALNLIGFPEDVLPTETLAAILNGAQEVLDEAKVALLGGHSVRNPEPIFGLAVTGRVHPDEILSKAGARAGDRLILTKPLGTGILSTALQRGRLDEKQTRVMTRSMRRLNGEAMSALEGFTIHGATDVTGFGLLGHLHEMASQSGLRAVVDPGGLEFLPGTREMASRKAFAGGLRSNQQHLKNWISSTVDQEAWPYVALFDPQTSGGLLLSVPRDDSVGMLDRLRDRGVEAFPVGFLEEGRAGELELR